QVVEGVSFLHEQNIAHLDIKDTNFVVDIDTGRIYIIDYGLARRVQGPDDEVEGFRGTEDWVAPEV
ncbi:kinase domain-containing protein, partial [Sparassis latifolia]